MEHCTKANITMLGLTRTVKEKGKRSKFIAECHNESNKETFRSGDLHLCKALDDLNHYLTTVNAGFKVVVTIGKYNFNIRRIYG